MSALNNQPKPGEVPLKQFCFEEAEKNHVSVQAIRKRIWVRKYDGEIRLHRVTSRTIFVERLQHAISHRASA
jgi:hypothetical protein